MSSTRRDTGASGGGGGGGSSLVKNTMVDLLERLPDNFEMITMQLRAKALLAGDSGPFVVVALQVSFLAKEELDGASEVNMHDLSPWRREYDLVSHCRT